MSLNFISKTEQVTVDSVERIERITIREGVVTAYFAVRVGGVVRDTFNVERKVEDLDEAMQRSLNEVAAAAVGWLGAKRNPAPPPEPEPEPEPPPEPEPEPEPAPVEVAEAATEVIE